MTPRTWIILALIVIAAVLVLREIFLSKPIPESPPMRTASQQQIERETAEIQCPGLYTANSDGSDPSMPAITFEKPWQWLADLFYTAVYIGGSVCLGVLLLLVLVLATGLHRVIF